MRDMLEARKRGDFAFRDKDFKTAIDCYSQVGYIYVLYVYNANYQYAWSLYRRILKYVHKS